MFLCSFYKHHVIIYSRHSENISEQNKLHENLVILFSFKLAFLVRRRYFFESCKNSSSKLCRSDLTRLKRFPPVAALGPRERPWICSSADQSGIGLEDQSRAWFSGLWKKDSTSHPTGISFPITQLPLLSLTADIRALRHIRIDSIIINCPLKNYLNVFVLY